MSKEKIEIRFDLLLIVTVLSVGLIFVHLSYVQQDWLPFVFGEKEGAFFDWWAIQHLLTGFLLGSFFHESRDLVSTRKIRGWQRTIFLLFLISFCWEVIELILENHFIVTNYEHWANRVLSDPMMVLIGGAFGYRYRNAWIWASGVVFVGALIGYWF